MVSNLLMFEVWRSWLYSDGRKARAPANSAYPMWSSSGLETGGVALHVQDLSADVKQLVILHAVLGLHVASSGQDGIAGWCMLYS